VKKNIILEEILVDMKVVIEETNLTNINEKKEILQHYLEFMNHLSFLKDSNVSYTEKETIDDRSSIDHDSPELQGYKLDRKLKGGILQTENNQTIYVPESIIRSMSFLPGDLVAAEKISERHYSFSLVDRPDTPEEISREQIDYGIVKHKDNIWIVEEHIVNGQNQLIKINDTCFAFILSDHEVQEFSLKEGDVVDIAYSMQHDNGDMNYKVIWKHNHEQIESSSPTPASFYKKKSYENSTTEYEGPDLDNKRVLMIGLEGRKTTMKKIVENFNGIFEWTSGNESSTRYEPMVKRADIVVAFRSEVRHKGTNRAVEYCKKYSKLFLDTPTNGVDSFISVLNEAGGKLGMPKIKTNI
jgi:hypothetical protein